jgi:flagellar hook protein FlgE
MGLTSAILTGFTGIQANQVAVDTIGNNVANVNTTGYKGSRALFETLFVRTINEGTAPGQDQGGTNPVQTGYGVGLATIQRGFGQGSFQQTGVVSDLSVDGEGFFILESPSSTPVYTRDGSFTLNTENLMVSANGSFVQGFGASEDGTINAGTLQNLEIPLGATASASATTEATLLGNLDAAAEIARTGSVSVSAPMVTADGSAATAGTALTALVDADGNPLFADADVISIDNLQKGGIDTPPAQFAVGVTGSTYGELAAFVQSALGIDTGASAIGSPGVTIGDGTVNPAGALVITSNAGDVNALNLDATSIRNATTGQVPFALTTTPATGEGVMTSFRVFDSLGTSVDLRIRMVPESKTDAGIVWRYNVESSDDTNPGVFLGGGTVTFDQNGQYLSATGNTVSIARGDTGAVSPLSFNMDLSKMTGLTAASGESSLELGSRDGFAEGTLAGYEIGLDGVITGTFTNGQTRDLGQVALATFANNQGLVAQADNTYVVGVNSGDAVVASAATGAVGTINSGRLEISNVELSRELIGLITASNGFSAASRTIRTADDMLQELMLLVR